MNRVLSNFSKNESGSTIEFVIWLPVFVLVLSLIADTSLIYHGQSRVYMITQLANRAYSTGKFETADSAENYIKQEVAQIGGRASADVSVDDGIIHSVVTVPAVDFEALGLFGILNGLTLTVSSDMLMEVS
ncbi:MAG: pilus assembly protein [Maritimibacter sp.]|jgi:hypothetical protein